MSPDFDSRHDAPQPLLRVLGRTSSINVRKVLWTCDELGLEYQREDWGSGFRSTREEEFQRLNPNGLIPVLVDADFVLWESNVICRYLAGRERRHDLLPEDPVERARVEQWMDWQATELSAAMRYAFLSLGRRSPAHQDAAAVAASVREWNARMQLLDAQLERSGGHVAGEAFTLADIVIGLATHRWYGTPIERPALPAVEAYYARLMTRPAFPAHARPDVP